MEEGGGVAWSMQYQTQGKLSHLLKSISRSSSSSPSEMICQNPYPLSLVEGLYLVLMGNLLNRRVPLLTIVFK